MKPLSYSLLAAALACGFAAAQTTAYTTPVGYVSLGNTAGPAIPANTDMTVAIPLQRAAEWSGTVASVAGSVITLTGTTGFTDGQWVSATTPYVVTLENGAESGLNALVTANVTVGGVSTVTVSLQNTDTLTAVIAGNRLSIRKAWTIGSFFAGNTLPNNIEFSLWEGTTPGTDNAPDKVFYLFDGVWYDAGDDSPSNHVVLYPNEGFRLRNTTAGPIAGLVITGEVPTANSRIFTLGAAIPQDTRISFFSPVNEPIATSGLGNADNDQLLSYSLTATGTDNAPAKVYYKFGASWYDAEDDTDVTATLSLKPGVGYVYRAAAGTSSATSKNLPDYVPSL